MKRRTLTDIGVATLKPRAARYTVPDPELRGHYVRVAPTGAKAFLTVTRAPSGKQVWTTIGPVDALSIEQARIKARDVLTRVRAGMSIEPAKASTFEAVADSWRERHVQKNGLRSEREVTRLLRVHVYPAWKEREFLSIRRSDMAALLDHVEDNHSARQADYVLNVVRSIMNWYATRNDDYTPPIVRGMRRQNPQAQARARILSDDEVRLIWKAAEANGTFGGILRLCLLTAQRSRKVTGMRWLDVSVDGEWTIPAEAREKGTGGSLVLPEAAISIIRAQPRMETNPFVFAGRGGGAFAGFSQAKTRFDAKLPAMPPWVIHDLRRSARSLMSRAGIRPDVAERVMGHVISGVEGVYDRHHYREEKADALRRLAAPYRKHREPADRKRSVSQRERVMGIKRSKPIWKVSRAVRAKAARDLTHQDFFGTSRDGASPGRLGPAHQAF
jgi:integrase